MFSGLSWILVGVLELHGMIGGLESRINDLPTQSSTNLLFLASLSERVFPAPSLILRVQGDLYGEAASRQLLGALAFQVTPPSYFSSTWELLDGEKGQLTLLLRELSVKTRVGTFELEGGRLLPAWGLNPWISLLDPLGLGLRGLPLQAVSGADGMLARWILGNPEVELLWLPLKGKPARLGAQVESSAGGFDWVGQVWYPGEHPRFGLGLQGNILGGTARLEANHEISDGLSELSLSYGYGLGPLLLELTGIFRRPGGKEFRLARGLLIATLEQIRWGGMVGLDFSRLPQTTAFWLETHYWVTSELNFRTIIAYTWTSAFLLTRQTFLLAGVSAYL